MGGNKQGEVCCSHLQDSPFFQPGVSQTLVLFPREAKFWKYQPGGFNLPVLFSYVLLSITELQIIRSSKGQNPFFFFQEELIQNCYSSPIIVLSIVLYRIFTRSSKCHKAIILDKYNIQAIAPDARTFC